MTAFGVTERMLHLMQVPVAARLSPGLVRILAGHLTARTFAPGEAVAKQGDLLDAMVFLTAGTLELTRGGERIGELSAPQTLGFLGVLANGETPYDTVARTEVDAFELSTDVLLELFEEHFELLTATLRYLAERLYFDSQELPAQALAIPPVDMAGLGDKPSLDLVDRVLAVQKTSGFGAASVHALATIARTMEERRVPAGTKLWSVGDPPHHAAFVVAGTVRCRTADGRSFAYGAGTGVGGLETLAERARWYEAVAETDLVLLLGQTEDLLDAFAQHHSMAMGFLAMLARAQIALLERRARLGRDPLAVRDVSSLGGVRVGA